MMKTILSVASAGVLATAGLIAEPRPANAVVWWVAPAIVGTAILGVGTGAVIADANARQTYAYEPRGTIYVEPSGSCRVSRELVNGVWRRVRICD